MKKEKDSPISSNKQGIEKEKKEERDTGTGVEELSIEKLKEELEQCQQLKEEYLSGWQRARADLLNYKKEETERMEGFLKNGLGMVILKMLPILDSFDMASSFIAGAKSGKEKQVKQVSHGFLKIKVQLEDLLKEQGLEEIKVLGEKMDLGVCEVAGEAKNKNVESGTVMEVIRKGYKFYDRIIRPAKVIVSR